MARVVDLSVSLRPTSMERRELVLSQRSHEEMARVAARRYGVPVSRLPHGSFFATERVRLGSHDGTHLDAPYHFYPTTEGRPAKRLHEVPLEWCMAEGLVLDFRHKGSGEAIGERDVVEAIERLGRVPNEDTIVLIWTGGTDRYEDDPRFPDAAPGLDDSALQYLFGLGVRVMAVDSATIDLPIRLMTERLRHGDRDSYFPIHRAGRWRDWTHAEKLAGFGGLPGPMGFTVMLFPVKLHDGTGAWTRAVAVEDDWLRERPLRLADLSLPLMNESLEPQRTSIVTRHHDQSARAKAKELGLRVDEVPHAAAMDEVDASTHAGTHVDAPLHFGPGDGSSPALSVDRLPLEWFYGDGVLLDFAGLGPGAGISQAAARECLDRQGRRLAPGAIVLFRTGAAAHFADDPAFADRGPRLELEALQWLLEQGVRVVGCDAESLEGPTEPMLAALRSGHPETFFPLHYAGRQRSFCFLEKLDLGALPANARFKVAAFPVKLEGAGAAWARAVALLEA